MVSLLFFTTVATVLSIIDWKRQIIPDKIILPAIVILVLVRYGESALQPYDFLAAVVVALLFAAFIFFDMAFGGGDIRFGVFCALFVGLEQLGWFLIIAGGVHMLLLGLTRQRTAGFAPAMSVGALAAYGAAL